MAHELTTSFKTAAATGLISWIESHGNHAIDNGDGSLTVTSIECKDGIAREIEDVIPATLPAARDLLGY